MTDNMMGLITLNDSEEVLRELTLHRPLAAVPFGGRYRLIDFVLSNMVNSGIVNVGILLRHDYRSLVDHLRSGKDWDLARKQEGLFLLPPPELKDPAQAPQGDLDIFWPHLDYLKNSRQSYLVIAGCGMVCNLDFRPVYRFHQEKQADVTVIYKEYSGVMPAEYASRYTVLETGADGRVTDMADRPGKTRSMKVSLGMYIILKDLFIDLLHQCAARGGRDFLKDSLIKNLAGLRVFGWPFAGYVAGIHSVQSYYRHSMDLLRPAVSQELFFQHGPVYTKVKDEAPVKYGAAAKVKNALLADGCVVEGTVENSVLFRGVRVGRGAYVKNSIIMDDTEIGDNAAAEDVICDKDVRITAGKRLKGVKNYPFIIAKGAVV